MLPKELFLGTCFCSGYGGSKLVINKHPAVLKSSIMGNTSDGHQPACLKSVPIVCCGIIGAFGGIFCSPRSMKDNAISHSKLSARVTRWCWGSDGCSIWINVRRSSGLLRSDREFLFPFQLPSKETSTFPHPWTASIRPLSCWLCVNFLSIKSFKFFVDNNIIPGLSLSSITKLVMANGPIKKCMRPK